MVGVSALGRGWGGGGLDGMAVCALWGGAGGQWLGSHFRGETVGILGDGGRMRGLGGILRVGVADGYVPFLGGGGGCIWGFVCVYASFCWSVV